MKLHRLHSWLLTSCVLLAAAPTYAQFGPYGQSNQQGPSTAYGQYPRNGAPGPYGQSPPVGQVGQYGSSGQYSQANQYGQPNQYGQSNQYGRSSTFADAQSVSPNWGYQTPPQTNGSAATPFNGPANSRPSPYTSLTTSPAARAYGGTAEGQSDYQSQNPYYPSTYSTDPPLSAGSQGDLPGPTIEAPQFNGQAPQFNGQAPHINGQAPQFNGPSAQVPYGTESSVMPLPSTGHQEVHPPITSPPHQGHRDHFESQDYVAKKHRSSQQGKQSAACSSC